MHKTPTISHAQMAEQKPAPIDSNKTEVLDNLFLFYSETPDNATAQHFVRILEELKMTPAVFKQFSKVVLKRGQSFTEILVQIAREGREISVLQN